MTLTDMRTSDKDFLTPAEVAPVLGCRPDAINQQARQDAGKLGFPVCMMGTRVRIPRLGFLHWATYGNAPVADPGEVSRPVETA